MRFFKKFIFVFIVIFFVSKLTNAATGCAANGPLPLAGWLYTTLNSGTEYDLYGSYDSNPNATFCVIPTGGSCTIKGVFTYTGYLVSYNPPAGCPIDDYIPYIIMLTGLFGFYQLKNKHKLA